MKAKESEIPEAKLQTPSFKHRSTSKLPHRTDSRTGERFDFLVIKSSSYPCEFSTFVYVSSHFSRRIVFFCLRSPEVYDYITLQNVDRKQIGNHCEDEKRRLSKKGVSGTYTRYFWDGR